MISIKGVALNSVMYAEKCIGKRLEVTFETLSLTCCVFMPCENPNSGRSIANRAGAKIT